MTLILVYVDDIIITVSTRSVNSWPTLNILIGMQSKRILRYLNGTVSHGLNFKCPKDYDVTAFCDADWASDPDDQRSTSGFTIFLGPNLVAWQCKK
ncbi:uncharacterized mitochondrial protein AtMg00810-like [Cannabis sativa]|uniref:uncharacterized mitochondrial protein AtMg00810-like n=1 Tax=Cannabis sativa TaxID=3483 RepID=UPI0029CA582C|nr:uncharacterized mitochondrial protein AtMg00810-like [Cannabis sativa]